MFFLFIVVIAFIGCEAGYDHNSHYDHSYDTRLPPLLTNGYSSHSNGPFGGHYSSIPYPSSYGSYGLGLGGLRAGPHLAAPADFPHVPIHSERKVELAPVVAEHQPSHPQVIEVNGDDQPVQVIFRSQGSRVFVQQVHSPSPVGHVETTRSEDEPHRVVHEVHRPVIQEVIEVIQPYRRVTQEIRPVLEEVHTVVAKGEKKYAKGLATGLDSGATLGSIGYKSKKA